MLIAAAVCPCPPSLVPEVAAGAAGELDALRTACDTAVAGLFEADPDRVVVLGPQRGDGWVRHQAGSVGSLLPFGVDLSVTLGQPTDQSGKPSLPAALTLGAWLLRRQGPHDVPCAAVGVGEAISGAGCQAAGRDLAAQSPRLALLVMGDGSACRSLKSPGYLDERAVAFDGRVATALAEVDTDALARLDPELARTLMVEGRAPWQVLAGAAQDTSLAGRLLYDAAPYGVGYVVSLWR